MAHHSRNANLKGKVAWNWSGIPSRRAAAQSLFSCSFRRRLDLRVQHCDGGEDPQGAQPEIRCELRHLHPPPQGHHPCFQQGHQPRRKVRRSARGHCSQGPPHWSASPTCRYLSLHNNQYVRYFPGHTDRVVSLAMNPLNDMFMSASTDRTVKFWDLRTNDMQGMLR